eukprot:2402955-Pyramimonas_sp.AAC.1
MYVGKLVQISALMARLLRNAGEQRQLGRATWPGRSTARTRARARATTRRASERQGQSQGQR